MKNVKRILAIVLALCMILSSQAITILATEIPQDESTATEALLGEGMDLAAMSQEEVAQDASGSADIPETTAGTGEEITASEEAGEAEDTEQPVEGDAETAVQPAEDGAGIAAEETGAEEAPVVSDADQEVSSPSDEEVALTPWEIPTEEEMNEPEEAEQPATSEEEQSVSNETELVTPETAEQPVLEEVEQSTPEETVVGDVINQVTTVDVNFLDSYGDTTKSAEAETGEVLTATIALTHSDPSDNAPAYAQIKLDYDPDLVEMTTVFNENNWSNITFEDPTSHAQTTLRVFYDTTNNTLTYEVPHGATLVVDLTFATKNGVTPDDTKVTLTPTLVEEDRVTPSVDENDEVGDPATGTWNADFSWDPIDKKVNGQDSNKIALNNDGTFEDWLHYSFTANSGNNEDAGAIWTDYIIVEDTLKLPEGFSFDDSVTISETDETVLCKDGIEVFDLTLTGTLEIDYNILRLTIDNNTIYFQVKIYNTNKTTREINNLNFSAELDTAIIKTPEGYASGNEFGDEIVNVVDVYEFPVTGDSRPHSSDSVITTTSGNEGYDVYKDSSKDDTDVQPGDTIDYKISLKNTGANTLPAVDDNGNPYTVTDTLPNGVYLTAEQQQALRTAYGDAIVVTENTITYTPGEMAAGTERVIAFNATVRDADALASMQIVDNTPLTNTVYYRDDSSHVMSRVRIGEVTVYKTKNTTEVLKDGDTASFSITVANDTDYSAGITENMTDTLPAYLPIQNVYQDTDNDGQPNGDAIDFSSDAAKNQTYSNVLVLNPVDNTYYRANISVDGNGKQTMTIVVDSDHGLGAHKSYTYGYTVKFLAEKVTSSDKVDECGVVTYTNVATLENGKKDDEPIEGEVGKLGVDKTADSAVDAEGNTVDVNGELEDGAVVDYSIEVSNDADHPYRQDIVVTDTLPAGTFPVGLKTTDGTEINTIDEYYAARNNNKSFTLDGVAVGVSENNKALTITWTIENPTGTGQLVGVGTPYKISYKAKVVTDYINSTAAGVKTLTNKVTVGPESDTAKIKVNAKGLAIEKYAVIDEEEVKNVTVTDSKEVTYKLRITNQKNTDLMANNVWDILPSWDADSSAGTVASSQYWQLGETVIVADDEDDFNDHWYYSNGQIGLNNNYLTWSQLKVPANTTLEQKVTLIFPDNVKATVFKGKETSDNQFQIEGTDPEKVTHEPESHKKYSLQKSVAALSGLNEHNQKYGFSSKDIFLVGETKYVYYAVTFFNTGEGDILLETLEDDLPVGLTYVGMVNRDYKAGVNGGPEYSTNPITTLDYSDCVVTPDGYGWQGGVNLSATANGQKISIAVNDGEGAVIKEKKGIYFYIMATISDTVEEGEDLTNTVRATVEGDSELNPLYHELMNTPDDEVKNNGDIVDAGKTAEGDNIVESSVTIHPKNVVVPGIEKTASAYSATGEAGTWEDLDHTTNINSQNYIKWTIKLYNDGTIPLKNYTVTDNLHHYEKFVRVDSFIIKNAAGTPTHDGDYATDDAFIIDPLQTGSTNTENNKIIVFEIRDDKYAIPAGGYATMELVTTYISGQFYGLIDNWAMLKPDEEFDANSVRHGQLEKEATDTSERYAGVSSSDYVNALGAAGTVSEKIIYEKDNTSNKGEGNLGNVNKHFIYVDGTDDLVTYVNHIQNVSEYALKTLVMIDRLPEIGDAGVVNRTARDSEFTVDLAEAMNLKVELLDENGETKFTLTQGTDFTIEYSEKTGFEDGDFGFYEDNTYAGISNEGWSTTQTGAKSFRIRLIPDKVEAKLLTVFPDGLGDGDHVLPSGWALNVTYDGKISDDATPGQFAWNSFGYRYQVAGFDPLTAEPPKVGVGIPPQPILKKVVVNDEDVDQGVNEDAKFHFMVYELNEDGVNWTKLWDEPVEIAQGKTFDLKAKRTINGETTGDFIDGKTYRFIEVPDSSYEVYYWSVNDLKSTDTLDSFDIYENIHYVDVEFKEYEDIIVVCGNILPRGELGVTKTFQKNGALDTTYNGTVKVGLFTKDEQSQADDSYTKVEEKQITITNGQGSVTFPDLDLGTYYVFELDDDGNRVGTTYGKYKVTGSGSTVTFNENSVSDNVQIINNKEEGQITVNKTVKYNGETDTDADDLTFDVALYTKEGETYNPASEPQTITVTDGQGSTTFEHLALGTYYVFEMNGADRVDTLLGTYAVTGSGEEAKLEQAGDSKTVNIINAKTETGKITVNKTVKYNGAVDTENAEDFYVGLFKTNDEGVLEQVDETKKISTTAGTGSVDFTGLALGTYTVYEMKDGQRITDGKLGDYTVTGSGTEVTPARGDLEKTVEIINAKTEKGKITVDKTVKYNGQVDMEADSLTFDVALFTDEEGVIKKASDVQTITVTDGKGSTTFNDLDFDTYYVYEMDGDQRVEEELGAFTVSGSGTEVALARTKQSDEVEIVNAKTETGEIEVTKSVFYNGQIDTINSDTFTVGLFTKDGENYEQVGATQTFTMSSGTGKATFPDLALGTYYVFEMDGADRVENKFGAYSVTGSGTEVAITRTNLKGTAEIINSQSEKGEIVVTKKLLYNGVADTTGETSEVKVGLFTKDGEEYTKVREGTISLTAGTGNCVFSDLDFTTYYVYELDESGNSVDDTFGSWTVTGSGTSVELARDSKNGQVTITNDQVEKGQITVNKTVKYNGVLDTTNAESFSVAIFTKDGEELQQVGPAKSIQTAEGVGSVTFDDLDLGTYYVYELDEDGNCVGSALESYTVTGSGAQATLGRGALTATLEIVNELVETGKITVNKTVKYNGETDTENEADFDVALFKLGLDNGLQQVGEIKTITTSDGVGSVDFDNLELGTYCVYEMHDGIRIENGKLGDYTVSGSGTDVTLVRGTLTGTVDVVNAKSEKGQIVVDKTVKYNGETDAEADGITFDVAIFTRDGDTYTQIGDAKTITVTDGQGSVTFTDVDFGTYYVFELDAEGNPVNTTYNPYVVTNSGTEVTLSRTSKSATVGIINAQEEKGSVTVNKTVKYAGEVNTNSSESFNVGLFRKDGSEYTQVGETKTIQTEAGTGSVTFGDLVFGTYYVFELDAEGNRVSDVLGKYDVTGSGTQAVLSRASKTAEVNIVNNEKAPTVVKFSGTKTLTGKTLEDGKFTFELREGTDASADPIQTATNKNGKFEFTELSFDATGTYQYMITEHIPEEGDADYIKGVTYDSTVYNVTVTVEAGENAYTATITGLNTDGSGADFDFTNSYVPSSTYAIFEGTKTFEDYPTGKTPPTFEFILSENGSEIDRTSTVGSGTFKFDSITYDSVGNHTYTVVEKKITAGGVTCDETEYTVKVAVTDVGGELKATVSDNAKKLDFTNTYEAKPVSVGFEAHKTLKDSNGEKTLKGGEYAFALKDAENVIRQTKTNDAAGNVAFDAISFSKAGTYTYTISENIPDKKAGGITYSTEVYTVTVEVTDDGTGQLAAEKTVTDSEGAAVTLAEFENVYDATGSFTLKGEKELTGREFRTGDSFTFTVTGSDGAPLPTPAAVTINPTSGTTAAIEFTAIGYGIKDVGKTYTYTVTESGSGPGITNDIGTHTVEVKISDNGDGTLKVEETYSDGEALAFENTYDATGESVLKGAKTLTGREFKEGDSFTFTVTGSDGAPLPDPAAVTIKPTSGYSAEFEFAAISYGLADVGKTYTYTVTETGSGEGITNDTGTHTVTVTVADNYDGTLNIGETYSDGTSLAFVNKYTVSGQAEILAKKNFTGRAWKDGDAFTFKLEAVDGAPLPETTEITVTNDTVTGFGNMTYDAVGTYEYKVTEVVPEDAKKLPGVTYTDKAQTVKVVATDPNLNGELVMEVTYEDKDKPYAEFTNTYKAGPTEQVLKATKVLEGGELTADAFSFVLTDSEGKVLETVKNKADGSITFSAIPYTFEDLGGATEKSFTYTITEVEGSLTGYVYDLTVHKAVVTVKDNPATGKLEASVVYDPSTNDSSTASSTTDSDATSADTGSTSSATTAETIPVITNKTIEFLFNKVDATGTKEIAGAVMVLYYVDDSGKEKELTRWTSKVSEVWNFGPALECGGKYILREELAPTGYGRVTQDIEITVAADGTITTGLTTATDTDGNKIYLLADNAIRVPILKTVAGTTTPLKGAELVVYELDSKGKEVTNASGEKVEVVRWVTKAAVQDIGGYLDGGKTYKLVELKAPSGYNKFADVTFTVAEDGTITTSMKSVESSGTVIYIVEDTKMLTPTPTPTTKKTPTPTPVKRTTITPRPTVTTTVSKTTTSRTTSAKTGDDSPIEAYLLLLVAAAAVIAVTKRRTNANR